MDLGPDLNNPMSIPISIHSATEDQSAKHEESNMEQLSMPSVSPPTVPRSGSKQLRSTQKIVTNLKLLEHEIKQLRIQMQNALQNVNLVTLREADQIKKPQKYMYFSSKLFKILYDLITQANYSFSVHNKSKDGNKGTKKKALQAQINKVDKDFNKDLNEFADRVNTQSVSESEEDLEAQIFQKMLYKLLMQADVELKKFNYQLMQDQQKSKEKELGLQTEKEQQNDWIKTLKPFICQNNLTFQAGIYALSKNIKRLIEHNQDTPQNLKYIQEFAVKLIEVVNQNQNLSNVCRKAGNVFGRLLEAVRYTCLYTIKKSEKEMAKNTETPTEMTFNAQDEDEVDLERDENFDDNGFENQFKNNYVKPSISDNQTNDDINGPLPSSQITSQNSQMFEPEQNFDDVENVQNPFEKTDEQFRKTDSEIKKRDNLRAQIEQEVKNLKLQMKSQPLIPNNQEKQSCKKGDDIFDYEAQNPNIMQTQESEANKELFKINLIPVDCASAGEWSDIGGGSRRQTASVGRRSRLSRSSQRQSSSKRKSLPRVDCGNKDQPVQAPSPFQPAPPVQPATPVYPEVPLQPQPDQNIRPPPPNNNQCNLITNENAYNDELNININRDRPERISSNNSRNSSNNRQGSDHDTQITPRYRGEPNLQEEREALDDTLEYSPPNHSQRAPENIAILDHEVQASQEGKGDGPIELLDGVQQIKDDDELEDDDEEDMLGAEASQSMFNLEKVEFDAEESKSTTNRMEYASESPDHTQSESQQVSNFKSQYPQTQANNEHERMEDQMSEENLAPGEENIQEENGGLDPQRSIHSINSINFSLTSPKNPDMQMGSVSSPAIPEPRNNLLKNPYLSDNKLADATSRIVDELQQYAQQQPKQPDEPQIDENDKKSEGFQDDVESARNEQEEELPPVPQPTSPKPISSIEIQMRPPMGTVSSISAALESTQKTDEDLASSQILDRRATFQDMIDKLHDEFKDSSVGDQIVKHRMQKSSQNPYLFNKKDAQAQGGVQDPAQSFQNNLLKLQKELEPKDFMPEYGCYHPLSGIPVYKIDHDFDNDDGFKITPTKMRLKRQQTQSVDKDVIQPKTPKSSQKSPKKYPHYRSKGF